MAIRRFSWRSLPLSLAALLGGISCTGTILDGRAPAGSGTGGSGGHPAADASSAGGNDASAGGGSGGDAGGADAGGDLTVGDAGTDVQADGRTDVPNSCPAPAGTNPLPLDDPNDQRVRVFIAAGQSNMVGSDSNAAQIDSYPPYAGAGAPQTDVRFSYSLEREMTVSNGWVPLAPVNGGIGPEISFARKVTHAIKAPIAIIKCAVGGTTLWQDWAPSAPAEGLQLYPRTLALVKASLKALDDQKIAYRLEGILWHQGENDMLDSTHVVDYEKNLRAFIASLRGDLATPNLPFYVGEVSTKGVWAYDNWPNMKKLRDQQQRVVASDPSVHWVPTSHGGFLITSNGLHYHFGTLGQLVHGEAYADAYLSTLGGTPSPPAAPYCPGPSVPAGKKVQVFILMGQRSMDGEAAWVQSLGAMPPYASMAQPQPATPYQYFLGGGVQQSSDWTPLGPAQFQGWFGPELTLGASLAAGSTDPVALIKVSDGGAAMPDWAPQPTDRALRPIYASAMAFVKRALNQLDRRGIAYEIKGVFWAHGETDSWAASVGLLPDYAAGLKALMTGVRADLGAPALPWFIAGVSDKLPWTAAVASFNDVLKGVATQDGNAHYVDTLDLPFGYASFETEGNLKLGERFASAYLQKQ